MTETHGQGPLDPVLILGVEGIPAVPAAPLFAAIHVTQDLVDRIRHFYALCRSHKIEAIQSRWVEPPVYWDFPSHDQLADLAECATHWHVKPPEVHLRLWGRLKMANGNLGPLEPIARSRDFDLFDLQYWRDEGYLVALHSLHPADTVHGRRFADRVYRRMVELELWPALEPPP